MKTFYAQGDHPVTSGVTNGFHALKHRMYWLSKGGWLRIGT
jgi:hypothetical protein